LKLACQACLGSIFHLFPLYLILVPWRPFDSTTFKSLGGVPAQIGGQVSVAPVHVAQQVPKIIAEHLKGDELLAPVLLPLQESGHLVKEVLDTQLKHSPRPLSQQKAHRPIPVRSKRLQGKENQK